MGYMYVARDDDPMISAQVGETVRLAQLAPPWIVVDTTLERVIVATWPGRLLRVQPVPPKDAIESGALARAAENLRADACYVRVFAVEVLEELTPTLVFGPQGDVVGRVLDAALSLNASDLHGPLGTVNPAGDSAYRNAWNRWKGAQRADLVPPTDYSWIVKHNGSPIGDGLSVLATTVRAVARKRGGTDAFVFNDEGDEALAPRWQALLSSLLHAALALGAPNLVDRDASITMTRAWNSSRFAQ